jgi:hypothetical protein
MTKSLWPVEMELTILYLLDGCDGDAMLTEDIQVAVGDDREVVLKCLLALRRAGVIVSDGCKRATISKWWLAQAVPEAS